MLVGKKIFPYPVLNRDITYSSIENSFFNISNSVEIEYAEEQFIIKNIFFDLKNKELMDLYKEGKIEVFCVVESSSSIFRQEFKLTDNPQDIYIDINNLKDRVEISAYGTVYSKQLNYNLKSFDNIYKDDSFNLTKNNIILIDDGFSVNVEYDEREDDIITSIFTIIKDKNLSNIIIVDPQPKKIIIKLPEEQFNIYDRAKIHPQSKNLFFSIILIPALIRQLTEIQVYTKSDDSQYNDIEDIINDFTWFASVTERLNKMEQKELTLMDFKEMDIIELSQKIIDYPLVKGIDNVKELLDFGVDHDDD